MQRRIESWIKRAVWCVCCRPGTLKRCSSGRLRTATSSRTTEMPYERTFAKQTPQCVYVPPFSASVVANNISHAQPRTSDYYDTERQGRALSRHTFGHTMIIARRRHGKGFQSLSDSFKHKSTASIELFDTTVPAESWTLLFYSPNSCQQCNLFELFSSCLVSTLP